MVVLAAVGAVFSPLLAVTSISVRGNSHLADETVRGRSSIALGEAMISVDGAAAQREISALPWVQHATVATRWPNAVEITVVERQPIAIIGLGDQRWVVAQGGVVVARATPDDAKLPVLTLPDAKLPDAKLADGTRIVLGSKLPTSVSDPVAMVGAIPSLLRTRMTGAALSAAGEVDVQLQCAVVLNLGTATLVSQKFLSAETVLGGGVDLSGLKRLDVRVPTDPRLERGGARCR